MVATENVDEDDGWIIDDGDSSQLVAEARLRELGLKINVYLVNPICGTCGLVLPNWRKHLRLSKLCRTVIKITKDDEDLVARTIKTVKDGGHVADQDVFLQGVRSKEAWACDHPGCGAVCGTTNTMSSHPYTAKHPRTTFTKVTAQRPTQSDPLIKVFFFFLSIPHFCLREENILDL